MIFKGPAFVVYLVCGLWGFAICFEIVRNGLGLFVALLSVLVAPAVLALAPFYAAFAQGDWEPLLLVYGGGIIATGLYAIGSAVDGR
jgi:hypothetical protein